MAKEIPKSIKASLYIDGKPAEASLKNIRQSTNSLRKELDGLTYGTSAWNAKMKELQLHERTLQNIKNEVKGISGAFGFLKTEIGKMGALAAGYLGFQFVTDQFQNIITSNAKLSDSLADVRKTTGLEEDGVRRLNDELKKIDTRSSRSELLGLAEIAGKLGIVGERDILGFVKAADKISVALGKDLGNTEQAVNDLGKLTDLFNIKEAYGLEEALIRTGSAINSLGAAGTANEGYLVEFSKRMGGIAPQANFSIESILGLAATMDELGQPVEASATAIGQFVIGMGKDIPGFARIAGLSVKEFTNLLKNDGNQALLEVLKNLKSTGQGVAGLAEKMGMVGEDGARAVAALGALSNNLDLLTSRQKLASEEFARGDSLQKEFDVKMATFGAVLDRTGKQLHSFTSNTILSDFLKNLVLYFSQLLSWGERNMVMIVNVTKLLLVAGAAWLGYRAALLLVNTALEVNIARTTLARTAAIAFAGAKALLTGNLTRAAAAMRALNITMAANPIGAVIAVVVALVAAIALFSKKTGEAQKVQNDFNSIEAESAKKQLDELDRIKALKAVLDDEKASREKKLEAIKKLNAIQPSILKGLTSEEALTNKGTVAINRYILALEQKTRAEAAQAKIRELQKRNIDIETGSVNDTSLWQDTKAFVRSGNMDQFKENQKEYGRQNALQERDENTRRIKAIQQRYAGDLVANEKISSVTTGGDSTGGLTDPNDARKAESAAVKAKRLFNDAEKERLASLARTEQAIMDSYAKELSETDEHFRKLIEKHKSNAAAVEQLERERAAKINEINERFQKENAAKILSIQNEVSQIATEAIRNDTDRELAELNNATAQKLQQLDREEQEVLQSINRQQIRVRGLKEQGKNDEAKILEDAIARELQVLDASGKLREQFLKSQAEKEKQINADAMVNEDLAQLEANIINSQSGSNPRYQKELNAKIALLDYQYKLEVDAAEKTGRSVAQINAKYLADRKQLEEDYINQKKDLEIQGAQLISDTVFTVMANNRRAESDARISTLEKQRDKELENQNLTEAQKKSINDKYDKQIKAEKLRAWKADQRAAISQAIINGALAVIKALPNLVLAGLAGAAAAAQIITIKSEKPPQFAGGGFSNEDPAGYVSRATVFRNSSSSRPFVAGEAGREWIAPNWMIQDPRYANIIGMLESARQDKRAFAAGGSTGAAINTAANPDNSDLKMLMMEMIRVQKEANDKKVVIVYKDLEEFQNKVAEIRNSSAA